MRNLRKAVVGAAVVASLFGGGMGNVAFGQVASNRADRLIVRWRDAAPAHEFRSDEEGQGAAARLAGARMTWVSRVDPRISIVDCDQDRSELARLLFSADERVLYAVADQGTGRPATVPDDTDYANQYTLYSGFKSCLEAAWSVQTDSNVVVAVVDSGVALAANDLLKNFWVNPGEANDGVDNDGNGIIDDIYGCEFVNPSDLPGPTSPSGEPHSHPLDIYFHGTEVFSMLAAEGDNTAGVAGTLWTGTVMSAKCYTTSGGGNAIWLSDAIAAIDYAVAEGATVLNCSWCFVGSENELEPLYEIMKASEETCLFVVAAGNDYNRDLDSTSGVGYDIYPAEFTLSNMIVVGSSTGSDTISSFSNYGAQSVDIFAPGEYHRVVSTNGAGSVYLSYSDGTSYAAPIVSGVCAMVWDANPSYSPQDVIDHVLRYSDHPTGLSGLCNGTNGCARLDPYFAMTGNNCP